MSKILTPTIGHNPVNYTSDKCIVYVYDKGNVRTVTMTEYWLERSKFIWKYAYIYDPGMSRWDKAISIYRHGNFYIYKKNMKTVRKELSPYETALFCADKPEVPKEFLTALLLLGVNV